MLISPQSPLIFMHIPKTGGMSLFTAFATQWGTAIADLYDVSGRNRQLAVDAINDPAKSIYCGHYPFGLHEFFERPTCYAAVVREPVDRVVSLYHYCLPILQSMRQTLQKEKISGKELFTRPKPRDFYMDFIPWMEGEATREAFFACPSAELDNGMVRRFSGLGLAPGPCPESALALAKDNIERHFSVVGVLERYAETLQLMERQLGIPQLPEHKVNDNPKRAKATPLAPELLRRIAAMNTLDTDLYRWVVERFDAQLANPGAAVAMPAGGRKDYENLKLWHAVGASPLREVAMKTRELPGAKKQLQCLSLSRVTASKNGVQLDLQTRPPAALKGTPPSLTQIGFGPIEAKRAAIAMSQAVQAYEKAHGVIELPAAKPAPASAATQN